MPSACLVKSRRHRDGQVPQPIARIAIFAPLPAQNCSQLRHSLSHHCSKRPTRPHFFAASPPRSDEAAHSRVLELFLSFSIEQVVVVVAFDTCHDAGQRQFARSGTNTVASFLRQRHANAPAEHFFRRNSRRCSGT